MSTRLAEAVAARRRAQLVAGLRDLARTAPPTTGAVAETGERCDLCGGALDADHRHLLNLEERRILCTCEGCWALRSGDRELRPTGTRTLWLEDFELPDELWAQFGIPIGLAFFLHSSLTECVVALYPSPAGATESELRFEAWAALCARNPILAELEPDAEALIVNRMASPPEFAIAPIDRCYLLVGLVKAGWEGISGGTAIDALVAEFFAGLRAEAVPA